MCRVRTNGETNITVFTTWSNFAFCRSAPLLFNPLKQPPPWLGHELTFNNSTFNFLKHFRDKGREQSVHWRNCKIRRSSSRLHVEHNQCCLLCTVYATGLDSICTILLGNMSHAQMGNLFRVCRKSCYGKQDYTDATSSLKLYGFLVHSSV